MKTPILVAAILALLVNNAVGAPNQARAPRSQRSDVQPLTYQNVLAHFKAARLRATEVQKRCTIFFEGEWSSGNVYNYALIIVENSDEDVQVTFYLTDAHEMNWVTEFVDAPFFTRSETESLFGLINSSRQVRNQSIGRYRVDFHRWQPKHAEILVFSFTPKR